MRLVLSLAMEGVPCLPFPLEPNIRWFSEARLPTRFPKRSQLDEKGEPPTHADGVVGHFSFATNTKAATLPSSLADITGDIVQNRRNALDNAAYAVSVASGRTDPKFTAFPFAGSVSQMPQALGRSKDLPPQIQSMFVGFQPYLGGDDLLWALNEMCVSDKHKMLIPIGTGVVRRAGEVRGAGFFSMPDPHRWDREKNEMELITLGPGAEFQYHFDFRVFVAINGIRVVDGHSVLTVLGDVGQKVESILDAIEMESHRLGIV